MPMTWVSRTCTPTVAIFMGSPEWFRSLRVRAWVMTSACCSSVSTRGVPSAEARWWRAASHSSSSACSTALSSELPTATEPWLAISAACRSVERCAYGGRQLAASRTWRTTRPGSCRRAGAVGSAATGSSSSTQATAVENGAWVCTTADRAGRGVDGRGAGRARRSAAACPRPPRRPRVTTVTCSGVQSPRTTPVAVTATRSPSRADTLPAVPTSRPSAARRRAAAATCSRSVTGGCPSGPSPWRSGRGRRSPARCPPRSARGRRRRPRRRRAGRSGRRPRRRGGRSWRSASVVASPASIANARRFSATRWLCSRPNWCTAWLVRPRR